MFRCPGPVLSALLLFAPAFCVCQGPTDNTTPETVPDKYRIIINRSDQTAILSGDFNHTDNQSSTALASLSRTFSGVNVGLEVFSVATELLSAAELCTSLKNLNQDVTSCEPDVLVAIESPSASPDDPDYPQQWNMPDIQMPTAWKTGQFGSTSVRVCMVDTGTDLTHPDLLPNLWINPVEKAGPGATAANGYQNGIDDDNNGIIDDIYGADFVDGSTDGNCQDQNGHGTFVAGVVGAVGNNDVGVTGVNQVASIVTCRFMDATGNGWVSDAIRCFDYCMSFDTQVLSNSWGGVAYSDSLQTAVNQASSRGVLVVCSAGNDGEDTDTTAHYPSSLQVDVILSVGASTQTTDKLWSQSNYGSKSVDIIAPGVSILSTGLGGLYITLSGTSMSTPHVSGTAALMLAQYAENGFNISTVSPNKGLALDLKKLIMSSADPVSGAEIASGHLNAGAALALVPLAAAASTESFGGNAPPGGVGAIEAYNPTQTSSQSNTASAFGGGGPGGIGGTAQVSIDSNTSGLDAAETPAPSNGFTQGPAPSAALVNISLPPAVATKASAFVALASNVTALQQVQPLQQATSIFGRKLAAEAAEGDMGNGDLGGGRSESSGSLRQRAERLQHELRQREARLRDIMAGGPLV